MNKDKKKYKQIYTNRIFITGIIILSFTVLMQTSVTTVFCSDIKEYKEGFIEILLFAMQIGKKYGWILAAILYVISCFMAENSRENMRKGATACLIGFLICTVVATNGYGKILTTWNTVQNFFYGEKNINQK